MLDILKATIPDINEIVELKIKMFDESGHLSLLADDASSEITRKYMALYENGVAQHFVIKVNSQIIAMSGGFIKDDIPYCFMRTPIYGFIGDVYTVPNFRNKGYATALTQSVMEWLKSKEVKQIRLLAADNAKGLYRKLGFTSTDEMMCILEGS